MPPSEADSALEVAPIFRSVPLALTTKAMLPPVMPFARIRLPPVSVTVPPLPDTAALIVPAPLRLVLAPPLSCKPPEALIEPPAMVMALLPDTLMVLVAPAPVPLTLSAKPATARVATLAPLAKLIVSEFELGRSGGQGHGIAGTRGATENKVVVGGGRDAAEPVRSSGESPTGWGRRVTTRPDPRLRRQHPLVSGHAVGGQRRLGAVRRLQFPTAAERFGTDQGTRGRDLGVDRRRQPGDQGLTLLTGGGRAAPQPKIAVFAECRADRGEVVGLPGQGGRRPLAAGEAHPPRGAVGDNVDRVEAAAVRHRRRDLARRRPRRIQHDRLHPRANAREQRGDVGNGRINEQKLGMREHGGVLVNGRQGAKGGEVVRARRARGLAGHRWLSNGEWPLTRLIFRGVRRGVRRGWRRVRRSRHRGRPA